MHQLPQMTVITDGGSASHHPARHRCVVERTTGGVMNLDAVIRQCRELLKTSDRRGGYINAVKHYRNVMGVSLIEARDAVDRIRYELPEPTNTPPMPAVQPPRRLGLTEDERQAVGEALTTRLAGMCPEAPDGTNVAPDWFDSRNIDEVLDVIDLALASQRATQ